MASNMDAGLAPVLVQPEEEGPPPLLTDPPRPSPSVPRERLPLPKYGKHITVLSIDGGGIRGLIPAVVLQKLEEELQDIDKNENARIADYFDVVAGTSTGGLIAAMLLTPDNNKRPKYTPQEIREFYLRYGPEIFPHMRWWWRWPISMVRAIWDWGPKYDGMFLHAKIREITGETTLDETLSTIVVPTFDVKRLEPIIFSSYKDPSPLAAVIKPKLSDVCIGTSAAPTYFPAHSFARADGKRYHLIDGGVAANNPTMAAISRVIGEQVHRDNEDLHALDYKKYLVISIGTGSAEKAKGEYTAEGCAKWSDLKWVRNSGNSPIIDIFSQATDVLVDWHVRMLLHNSGKRRNYLRIQAVAPLFQEDMLSMDTATRENMDKLVRIGEELLNKKVAMVDLTTGTYKTAKDEDALTNNEEIRLFAQSLVNERKLRLQNKEEEYTPPPPPPPPPPTTTNNNNSNSNNRNRNNNNNKNNNKKKAMSHDDLITWESKQKNKEAEVSRARCA